MKKWILFILLFVIILSVGFSYVYVKARAPLKEAEQYAVKRAKLEAQLISIDNFYLYHGSETYYVVIGKRKDQTQMVVWLPKKNKDDITIKKLSDGISEKEAIAKLYQEEKPKEILAVRLGMEEKLPIWEMSYLDEQSKLNYFYIHFDSGKWWRKIENL